MDNKSALAKELAEEVFSMEVSEARFTLQYADDTVFPASAPLNHPHILKQDESLDYEETKLIRLCDAIATLLHHLEVKQPGVSKDFFDDNVKAVKITRLSNQGNGGIRMDLMIWRRGNEVTAGFFNKHQTCFEWECASKSTINPDGTWEATWAAHHAYSRHPLERLAHDGFFDVNIPLFQASNPNDSKEALDVSKRLAKAIFEEELWEERDQPIFQFEIQKDN